jgi:hypothetical protein
LTATDQREEGECLDDTCIKRGLVLETVSWRGWLLTWKRMSSVQGYRLEGGLGVELPGKMHGTQLILIFKISKYIIIIINYSHHAM